MTQVVFDYYYYYCRLFVCLSKKHKKAELPQGEVWFLESSQAPPILIKTSMCLSGVWVVLLWKAAADPQVTYHPAALSSPWRSRRTPWVCSAGGSGTLGPGVCGSSAGRSSPGPGRTLETCPRTAIHLRFREASPLSSNAKKKANFLWTCVERTVSKK